MEWPISFDDVLRARERLRPYLPATPLRSYPALDKAVGAHVLVKHENHLPTNSFKVRNGVSALAALNLEQRKRGVIAATRGNHGQGVAWAGKQVGAPVTICVPLGNNPEKNESMRGLGAELIEEGQTYDDAVAVMERLCSERGLTKIHSTNDAHVIAGAGTMGLEIFEQACDMGEKLDAMVFAIGGGSQAVGAMTVLRHLRPDIRTFGVQAEQARAIHDSWHAGKSIVSVAHETLADGLATGMPYEMTFDALREGLSDFVLVNEDEIADAIRLFIRTTHNLAEGAGAAGLAGLRKLANILKNKTVAIVLSGSNIDARMLHRVICDKA